MKKTGQKSQEMSQRAELHRKIWAIADNVRGAVDGWDFKQYVLGILFYRFISENMCEFFNKIEMEDGKGSVDYAGISDEEAEKYKFSIMHGDTLLNPLHNNDKPFDAIVSNPPYSIKWIGDSDPTLINDERFAPAGRLAPKSSADYAFVLHSLNYLSSKGRACIVCFPGIFYRKGAEWTIRKYLIDNNFIDCIIQLPSNLFFGTSIATCILVMEKNKKDDRVLFIDASNEFKKETNNNVLTENNIEAIVEEFKNRNEKEYFSRLVASEEIEKKDYNLSVSNYVEKEDVKDVIDIKALNTEIEKVVQKIDGLRFAINDIIKEFEGVAL